MSYMTCSLLGRDLEGPRFFKLICCDPPGAWEPDWELPDMVRQATFIQSLTSGAPGVHLPLVNDYSRMPQLDKLLASNVTNQGAGQCPQSTSAAVLQRSFFG